MMGKFSFLIVVLALSVSNMNAQNKRQIFVDSFHALLLQGEATWVLIPAAEEQVIIESKKEEVFDFIEITMESGLLTINASGKSTNFNTVFTKVVITIYYKSLNRIECNGSGKVISQGVIQANSLTTYMRGSGRMELDIKTDTLRAEIMGACKYDVTGFADVSYVSLMGTGKYNGFELASRHVEVSVQGVGGANVNAYESLKAVLQGVGSIKYKGNPKHKEFRSEGIGNIKAAD
jgi:Putative auto-transporter adhesin, head GIN domain